MTESVFLSAEWRKLIIANYSLQPSLLSPFLPAGTELDIFNGHCYVSLVGFMFQNTRLLGLSIPFHQNFEEVNLRFYVRKKTPEGWRRGVVFLKEFVPRSAITLVANLVYKEHYQTLPMKHDWIEDNTSLMVSYQWKLNGWHSIRVETERVALPIGEGSEEEFITEHYWGFTRVNSTVTTEYEVRHPRWHVYPVKNYSVSVAFGLVYGNAFEVLQETLPRSVFLAEGSPIQVMGKSQS